jgi:hypothetical protein
MEITEHELEGVPYQILESIEAVDFKSSRGCNPLAG